MPTPEETKAMQAILDKLNSANTQSPVISESNSTSHNYAQQSTGNVSPDAQEMFNILSKLESATASTISTEVEQSGQLLLTETAESKVFGVGHYHIAIEDTLLAGKYKKKYYTIFEDTKPLYKDLALFESAMAIVKQLIEGKDQSKIRQVVELDEDYDIQLNEAAVQKKRTKTLTESIQSDVAAAKHSVAVGKMSALKKRIKRLL